MYEICEKKPFLEKHLWALQVFLCALVSRPVCARTHVHSLEGTLLPTPAWPNKTTSSWERNAWERFYRASRVSERGHSKSRVQPRGRHVL